MRARHVLLLFLSLSLSLVEVYAQFRPADSLKVVLEKEDDPQKRVDLLNDIAYFLYDFDDSAAFRYADEARSLAGQQNYPAGLKYAHTLIGVGYFNQGKYPEAMKAFLASAAVNAPEALVRTAYNYTMISKVYSETASYDSAERYLDRALALAKESGNQNSIANLYRIYGHLYLLQWKNEKAFEYLSQAEQILTKNVRNEYLMIEVCYGLGIYYENMLRFDKADQYYARMCELSSLSNDPFHLIKCDLRKVDMSLRVGRFADALIHCNDALERSESYYFPPQIVDIYFQFGEIYMGLSQHELAVKYFLEALKISEALNLRKWTADIYSELSWIQLERANDPQTLYYIRRAEIIRNEIGDKKGLGGCYDVKGLLYLHKKKYDSARFFFDRAKVIWESIDHEVGVSAIYFNISLIYQEQHNLNQALDYRMKTLEIEKRVGNKKELSSTINSIADLLIAMKQFKKAEEYLNMAHDLAQETGSLLLKRDNARTFASYYRALGDYKKSNDYLLTFAELNDSIFSKQGATKLAEMEAMYKVQQKEQQIKLLAQENELKENQLELERYQTQQQRTISIAAVIGFFVVSFFAWKTYQYNKRIRASSRAMAEKNEEIQTQSEELMESNQTLSQLNDQVNEKNEEIQAQSEELMEAHQTILSINRNLEKEIEIRTTDLKQAYHELDTFFYRSSHDFRRPLTTFMGLAEVAKITVKDPNALELFERVRETAHNLDKMLTKLQSISDVGAQQLVYKEVFIKDLVEELFANAQPELERKRIVADVVIDLQKPFYSYPALVKTILENLVENAIGFCATDDARIRVEARSNHKGVVISVRDNGQGIPEELHSRIFEMYFRGSERSKGNGLGLYIVKKAVEKLQGRVEFESQVHSGTAFNVFFPNQVS